MRDAGFPRQAMILAAGRGTRLRPLTDSVPKCMVPLGGKPILEHTIEWLASFSVTEIVVNLWYLPVLVTTHFERGDRWGVHITYSLEEEPLGTAGGLRKVASLFDGPFFVWYGDNLSTCKLDRLFDVHRRKGSLATIALFRREDVTQSGVVELDDDGRVTRFLEKPQPEQTASRLVNAGIYVLDRSVIDLIPEAGQPDFGRDIFPALLAAGRPLYGYTMSPDERLVWIDRPEDLMRANAEGALS